MLEKPRETGRFAWLYCCIYPSLRHRSCGQLIFQISGGLANNGIETKPAGRARLIFEQILTLKTTSSVNNAASYITRLCHELCTRLILNANISYKKYIKYFKVETE